MSNEVTRIQLKKQGGPWMGRILFSKATTATLLLFITSLLADSPAWSFERHAHHHNHAVHSHTATDDRSDDESAMSSFDHPLFSGSLNPAEAAKAQKEFISEYQAARSKHHSTVQVYKKYLPLLGSDRISNYFEEKNPSCHGVLHNMGKAVAQLEPNLIQAVGICSDACTYACVHGAIKTIYADRVASGKASVASVQQELADLCQQPPVIPDFFEGNCAHAAGHAFGILGKERLSQAISLCSAFSNPEMHFYCEGGVYMQLMSQLNRALLAAKPKNRSAAIRSRMNFCYHAGQNMSACMRFVMHRFRKIADLNIIRKYCQARNGSARLSCFNGLGFLARGKILDGSLSLESLCPSDEALEKQCISGFAFVKKGYKNRERIAAACRSLGRSSSRRYCMDQYHGYLYQIGNPTLAEMSG
ncbi:MAG: hypothetical protein D6698_16125 [Gammaproteobacteria bacterium]|nr:MAG: hypothetical protein D6698_16125 [Gammaproteobacteria bacterium]